MPYRQSGGCPKCGGTFLNLRTDDYSYLRCSKCIGIWMDWNVLEHFIEDIMPGQAWEIEGSHEGRTVQCRECRGAMQRGYIFGVPVDYCQHRDHGLWLDKDELREILERVVEPSDSAPRPPTSFTTLLNDFFNKRARD